MNEALKMCNKKLLILKESYTLEVVDYRDDYKGKGVNRCLFSLSKRKLLNAYINGAINIMRKYIFLTSVTGINLCNPSLLKI